MIPTRNARPITVLWPWQTAKLWCLTTCKATLHIRVMHEAWCVKRDAWCVLHVSTCTSKYDAWCVKVIFAKVANQCGSPVAFLHTGKWHLICLNINVSWAKFRMTIKLYRLCAWPSYRPTWKENVWRTGGRSMRQSNKEKHMGSSAIIWIGFRTFLSIFSDDKGAVRRYSVSDRTDLY